MRVFYRIQVLLVSAFGFTALAQTPATTPNCFCCSEIHKAFDFWVGDWEVTGPDGSVAGTNTIRRIQNGCVLQENWVGAGGSSTGTSLNFYNGASGQWEQLWVSNTGFVLKLKGNPEDGDMVLTSDPFHDAQGVESVHRIRWSPAEDGSVRQLWEMLQEGQVVRTLFDGIYRKKE